MTDPTDPTTPAVPPVKANPIAIAAGMVKSIHLETIALIDAGHVYLKDGADVSQEIKAKCLEEIAKCDDLTARSAELNLSEDAAKATSEIHKSINEVTAMAPVRAAPNNVLKPWSEEWVAAEKAAGRDPYAKPSA